MLPAEVHGEVGFRVRLNPNPNPRPHTIVWTGGRPHAIVAPKKFFDVESELATQ